MRWVWGLSPLTGQIAANGAPAGVFVMLSSLEMSGPLSSFTLSRTLGIEPQLDLETEMAHDT